MKHYNLLQSVYLLLLCANIFAQETAVKLSPIHIDSLSLSYSKTTSLIFQYAIKSVDKGSPEVLVQKAKGVENILQLKAAQECFEETNLTVVTANGRVYSFILNYELQPQALTIAVDKPLYDDPEIVFAPGGFDEGVISDNCKLALISPKRKVLVKDRNYGVSFQLNGLYIHENVLYLRCSIENNSNISFEPEQLRFLVRDKKKAKRTSSQEIELQPVFLSGLPATISSHSENTFVVALPKFTIPDKKYLAVQVAEKNGGRHYELEVTNKKLLKPVILD